MTDEPRGEVAVNIPKPQEYEPPVVEDLRAEDGPAVTAAGKSPVSDAD
jgi:hypothetical protein